ncbi:hypothetical protein AJ80_09812 [Polytolypa hystricis UAMH7299]|uniref:Uncharacterized protein n=1 Tax=Polytolypa hystricis (strain UAMH7299) TaxID=1447883 RepID=A0A2B7WIT8_POLH7|nr:hypothetical protein AJ80_09812 [Polytolypa hystricis UAMH7299]
MDSYWEVCTQADYTSKVAGTANPPALQSRLPVFPHDRSSPTFSQVPPPQTYNALSITPQHLSHPLPPCPPPSCYTSAASPWVQPNSSREHYLPSAGKDFDPFFDQAVISVCADANESNSLACILLSYDSNEGALSRRASDRRHGPKDTLSGTEDGVFEEADSNPSSTGTIPTGSVPLCTDASPQHGLATDNPQSSGSEQSRDPCPTPPVDRQTMIEPDDSTVDGSSLCGDFSPHPCPSSSCATSISGTPAAEDGGGKADSMIRGRPTSPPPEMRNRPSRSGGMQTMVAVQVPPSAWFPDSKTASPQNPVDKPRGRTQSLQQCLAQSACEVPPSCKRKRDDDTSISDLGGSSEDSDGSDDEYLASSEEESCPEKLSKVRKLSPPPRRTVSLCCPLHRRSPIHGADHRRVPDTECPGTVEWKGGHFLRLSQKQAQTLQCLMAKFTRAITTMSCCAHPPTAVSGVGSVAEDDEAVEHDRKGRRRAHWTTDEDDRLAALRTDGFTWPEIEERFPHRSLSSLRQRWYTKLQKRSHDIPRHPSRERSQVDDDMSKPEAKPSRPPRPSTSITVCPMCKCTVDAQALGASRPMDPTRMRFREQWEFCNSH